MLWESCSSMSVDVVGRQSLVEGSMNRGSVTRDSDRPSIHASLLKPLVGTEPHSDTEYQGIMNAHLNVETCKAFNSITLSCKSSTNSRKGKHFHPWKMNHEIEDNVSLIA